MTCDIPAMNAQLKDAETAYHELVLGRSARVIIDMNGERVEFVSANKGNLYSYILQLRADIAKCSGDPSVVRGPAGFIF